MDYKLANGMNGNGVGFGVSSLRVNGHVKPPYGKVNSSISQPSEATTAVKQVGVKKPSLAPKPKFLQNRSNNNVIKTNGNLKINENIEKKSYPTKPVVEHKDDYLEIVRDCSRNNHTTKETIQKEKQEFVTKIECNSTCEVLSVKHIPSQASTDNKNQKQIVDVNTNVSNTNLRDSQQNTPVMNFRMNKGFGNSNSREITSGLTSEEKINKNEKHSRLESQTPANQMTPQTDDPIEPVSSIRKRFEKMKLKFRKPSDSEPASPPAKSPTNFTDVKSPSNTANDLFKDIWSMKCEDLLGDNFDNTKTSNANARPNNTTQYSYKYLQRTMQDFNSKGCHETREQTTNLKLVQQNVKMQYESKVVNSLVSPTEPKRFFKPDVPKKNPTIRPGFDVRKTQSLPRKFKGAYLRQFSDSDDLPPPPTPPPTPNDSSSCLTNFEFNGKVTKPLPSPNSPVHNANKKPLSFSNNITVNNIRNSAFTAPKTSTNQVNNLSKVRNNVGVVNGGLKTGFSTPSPMHQSVNKDNILPDSFVAYLSTHQQADTVDCSGGTPEASRQKVTAASTGEETTIYDNMMVVKQPKNRSNSAVASIKNAHTNKDNSESKNKSAAAKKAELTKAEFHSALDDLEKEFMKLSDSIEIESKDVEQDPPKLPPKKRQVSSNGKVGKMANGGTTPSVGQQNAGLSESQINFQMKLTHLEQQKLLLQKLQERKRELLRQQQIQQQQQQMQLQSVNSKEDNRCSIIDEPLSTIEEEGSIFGESCASSVTGDEDGDMFESCLSSQSTLNCSSGETDPNQSLLSDTETELDQPNTKPKFILTQQKFQPKPQKIEERKKEEQILLKPQERDDVESSSDDEIQNKDIFRKSIHLKDEEPESDVDSVEWTDSPLQGNRIPRSVVDREGYERDIAELTGVGKPHAEVASIEEEVPQHTLKKEEKKIASTHVPEESSTSESEGSSREEVVEEELYHKEEVGDSTTKVDDSNSVLPMKGNVEEKPVEYFDDVTPYGVFDLSTLDDKQHPGKQQSVMGINKFGAPPLPSEPPNFSPQSPVFPMRQKSNEIILPGYDNLEKYNVDLPPKKERPKSGIGKHSTAVSALDRHEATKPRIKSGNEPKPLDSPLKQRSQAQNDHLSTQRNSPRLKDNRKKINKFPTVDDDVQSRQLPAKPKVFQAENSNANNPQESNVKYTQAKSQRSSQSNSTSSLESQQNKAINRLSNHYEELANYSKLSEDKPPEIPEKKKSSISSSDEPTDVQEIMDNILPPQNSFQPSSPSNVKNFPVAAGDIEKKNEAIEPSGSKPRLSSQVSSDSSSIATFPRRNSSTSINGKRQNDPYFQVGDDDCFDSSTNIPSESNRAYDADDGLTLERPKSQQSELKDEKYVSSDDDSFIYPKRNRSKTDLKNSDSRNKVISPSMRKKRSLLERSKSPSKANSHRRSKSPSHLKTHEEESDKSDIPRKESRVKKFRRSLRRRSLKSGDESGKDDKSDDMKSDLSSPPPIPSRIAMRRSKSTDRETATKDHKKKKKNLRSKSLERPQDSDFGYDDDGATSSGSKRSSRLFGRGSKRWSRRGRSTERRKSDVEDPKRAHSRGRNPVSFIRKLLRRNKSQVEGDPNIVRIPDDALIADDMKTSEDDFSFKESRRQEHKERRNRTPPRSSNSKKPTPAPRMRSPLSHRAKKMQRNKNNMDTTGSSSDANFASSDHYENIGSRRIGLRPPNKPPRSQSSRNNSFSNSAPSSDSDMNPKKRNQQFSDSEESSDESLNRRKSNGSRISGRTKKSSHRLSRHSRHSKNYSDQETSTDADGKSETTGLRSVLKKTSVVRSKGGTLMPPRRPVRVVAPRLSKSDPSLFPPEETVANPYYNVFESSEDIIIVPPLPNKRKSSNKNLLQQQQANASKETLATQQRQKYRTLVSLNSQTLRKVSEKWLSEWRNQLPVGGFLITSWSDVTITSKRPLCMIGNSTIYPAHFTANPDHKVACQLIDQNSVSSRFLRQLENCSTLTANPNICGVCSHFQCRIPRNFVDPSTRSGMVDAVCVVLYSRPVISLTEYLQQFTQGSDDVTEMHRQLLLVLIQLMQGLDHLAGSGFSVSNVTLEHLVITQQRGLLQILPHLEWRGDNRDSDSSSDNSTRSNPSTINQVSYLIKKILKRSLYSSSSQRSNRNSRHLPIIPGSPYSIALQIILNHLEKPGLRPDNQTIISLAQCALWGPRELDEIDFDDMQPFSSLELWIDMEQAKLVNSLAVLPSGKNEAMKPSVYLKYQYFSQVNPQSLFQCLKTLERI